ncbi:hypothetical protein DL89DRAFT_290543 [Linderina pennispora]|uniref:Transferase n=1 Tax=Linderina pennispora TaxID=61395 RepID=A0A1Y1WGL4_9FUNG|nr:uncharacterized protein DL89DRAFT_290543 [Linderina pennispora]ORX72691.1 hypothetical protein DL89DRAFT_290543 [Linderina pennispora]
MARLDMGDMLPKEAISQRITGDTQFMFQFYKPCIHYFEPSSLISTMNEPRLRQSLKVALQTCPLLFSRFVVQPDLSVTLDYSPTNPNLPTLEFAHSRLTFREVRSNNFAYAMDTPMLMAKVTYMSDGGIAMFSMTNHVAFDGSAMFHFLAHWAKCCRAIGTHTTVARPAELEPYAVSLVAHTDRDPECGPQEISVDATRTPQQLMLANTKSVSELQACVFSISLANVQRLKKQTEQSGVLDNDEWVSSNNAVAAFVCQCVARANTDAQVYEAQDWTFFQSLDMRHPLGLPTGGLGSPLILAECSVPLAAIYEPAQLPEITRTIRQCVNKYDKTYCQEAMDWMNSSYACLAKTVGEPWRHFWFTALNTNRTAVGVSCMNRIPIYDVDFGAGRPVMARSFNPRPNYIIVFPGPPAMTARYAAMPMAYDSLHLYVTLEKPAMEALRSDKEWCRMCSVVSEF